MHSFTATQTAARPGGRRVSSKKFCYGLSLPQKALPSRFFYDEAGSGLFEQITELPEYYPTRTEIALLKSSGGGLRECVPPGAAIVEFGSGSSRKTELLLEALDRRLRLYTHRDIGLGALSCGPANPAEVSKHRRASCAWQAFTDLSTMKLPLHGCPCVGFFPGSTIGNLTPAGSHFLPAVRAKLSRQRRPVHHWRGLAKAARYSPAGL